MSETKTLKYAKNASKLHRSIGEILTTHEPWRNYTLLQEVKVSKINSNFRSNRERFDWVVKDIKLVIECHGRQHFAPVSFSGKTSKLDREIKFRKQQERDINKMAAANAAGYIYISVRYDEKITPALLWKRYVETLSTHSPRLKPKKEESSSLRIRPEQKEQRRQFAKQMRDKNKDSRRQFAKEIRQKNRDRKREARNG